MKIAALTVCLSASASLAAITHFYADLSGLNEVPANASPAVGTMTGQYDDVANTFSFSWSITDNLVGNPASPGSHIHRAPAGSNGPIQFGFNNPDGTWPLNGSATWTNISQQNIDALFNEGLYINFHTTSFPGGEVRGQIYIVPAPGAAALIGLGALGMIRRRR